MLTLIYPARFEDVACQSGVNHIYLKVKKIMCLDKTYIIVKRNVMTDSFLFFGLALASEMVTCGGE